MAVQHEKHDDGIEVVSRLEATVSVRVREEKGIEGEIKNDTTQLLAINARHKTMLATLQDEDRKKGSRR